jgi:hypothetical protein
LTCEVCVTMVDKVEGYNDVRVMKKHLSSLHKELGPDKCEECQQLTLGINEDLIEGKITMATSDRVREHIRVLHETLEINR